MVPSAFRFSNPILIDLQFSVNRNFSARDDIELNQDFKIRISKKETTREAIVELTVLIGGRDEDSPFSITVTEGAKFSWDQEADDKADDLLGRNAPALLLGYIRPIISSLTASSPFPAYNIPFIDFTKES